MLGEHDTWHKLDTCVWKNPFPLAGYQDLHTIYPNLEAFFHTAYEDQEGRTNIVDQPSQADGRKSEPPIDNIQLRLIDVGMLLAKNDIDANVEDTLNTLKKIALLLKRPVDGELVLIGVEDDFAIPDHARYGKTLESHGVSLDFKIDETQMHDVVTKQMRGQGILQ